MKRLVTFLVMLILCSIATKAQLTTALKFDGVKDYVDVPWNTNLNPSVDFTVELWARVDGGDGDRRCPLSSMNGSFDGYTFIADADNTWKFACLGNTAYGPSIVDGAWTHLAAVHTGGNFNFYVNGILVSTIDGSGYVVNPADDFLLGCDDIGGSPSRWFNGAITDVRFWNVARSASDIQSNMYTSLIGNETNLVALWKFNEGSGTTATDAKSSYIGTLTGPFNFITDGWITTALVIKSTTNGPWASGSTWVGGVAPISTDNVVIAAVHTVQLSSGVTCNNLDVSGTLNPNSYLATITGSATVENGGTIIVPAMTFDGNYGSVAPNLISGSTVRYINLTATIKHSFTYSNLQLMNNCEGTTDGDLTVNGTLTIQSGSALLPLNATSTIGGSGTLTGGGNVCVKHTGSATDFAAQFPITTTILTGLTVGFEGSAPQNVDGLTYHGLTISNSSGATLNGATTVSSSGTLTLWSGTLTNGSNLTLGNNTTIIVAAGTLSDAPTFGTTVNITYSNSGSPQTIAAGNKEFPSADILSNLTISNTSGVTLNRDVTVNGNLIFSTTNGCNLTIGSNNLTLKGGVMNPDKKHCVVTNSTGYVSRTIPASGGVFGFPIGATTTTFNCVQLTNNHIVPQTYTGRVVNSVSDVGNIQNTVLVTWFITSDLGQSTDLDFHWYTADAGIAVVQGSEMVWLNTTIPTGGTWLVQATPTRSTPSFNSTKLAGVSLPPVETRWTVGTFGALPVQMTKFTAMSERMGAELQWSTATEVNCYGFEVERRMTSPLSSPYQGSGWQKIGFVQGAGTSNSPKNYSYTDASVASGTYAYRLKQIDNDGTFEYSSEAEITLSVPKVLALNQNYPNPFNPSTTINFTLAEDSHVSLRVFDMLGREVATLANSEMKAVEVHNVLFDASRLSSGLYFYRLDAGKSSLVKKLMLLK